jgi:dTDP-4-dehydrorhamnose reductase
VKVLLLGAQSSIGRELIRLFDERQIEWQSADEAGINVDDPVGTARTLTHAGADQVINLLSFAAGQQGAVSAAESAVDQADKINHMLPDLLSQVCDHLHIPLIHLSSVYVFGGDKKLPYNEQDAPKPLGVYGVTMAAGEDAIQANLKQHVILRSGWLFGPGQDQRLKSWLQELRDNDGAVTVNRGKIAPTPVEDLARVIMAIALQVDCDADLWGTYHYAALEPLKESEFVQQLIKFAAQHDEKVYALLDHLTIHLNRIEPPLVANSTLATKKIFETFGIKQRPWQGSLQKLVKSWYKDAGRG